MIQSLSYTNIPAPYFRIVFSWWECSRKTTIIHHPDQLHKKRVFRQYYLSAPSIPRWAGRLTKSRQNEGQE